MKNSISKFRKHKGMTQNNVAEYLGITVRQYRRYEAGTADIPLSKLKALSKLYSASIDTLLDDPSI